ncbi:MAG TPA: carbohydrate ABC transporter permease [Nocardioidaceae bacterium]|nr:carbohydrate ABC transporter permease [Nocardioidaceae bacterium]
MTGRRSWQVRLPQALLGAVLLIWTLMPVYTMAMLALSPQSQVFSGHLYPHTPTVQNFVDVVSQRGEYVGAFWLQMANSAVTAIGTTVLVLLVGTLAAFGIARLRPRWGSFVSNAALATYVIPLSFVSIPLYKVMATYGLLGTRWSLVLAMTAFASPYAMWVFSQHSETAISHELDESARIDGASSWQIYLRIYLPLMTPVLVAIGIYAFLLAWNEYLLAFLLLGSGSTTTMPVALSDFLNTDNPPWNSFMAASLFYALPPAILYYLFRNKITGGLTAGSVKE